MIVHQTVSKSEFKPKALEYLRQVTKTQKPLVITHKQLPVAKITPFGQQAEPKKVLEGTVLKYVEPFEPVATDDWEALK